MKPIRANANVWRLLVILVLLLLVMAVSALAQVQTARNINVTTHVKGFYEYLPRGYTNGPQKYPLLVFLHGQGEIGNGTTQLANVLRNGPPKLISQGVFPETFTVNGQTFSFIVISPQFTTWPQPADVEDVINYAISHYSVDPTRIYLTGLSMGGGATWDYAGYTGAPYSQKLAAIVPISGASSPSIFRARTIVNNGIPVWATHNQNDPTVPSRNTIGYIDSINKTRALNIAAGRPVNPVPLMNIFPATGHDAWTHTYDPSFRVNGMNVYEWMLQYQSDFLFSVLPVRLSNYNVSVADNSVKIDWTTTSEQQSDFFTIERSEDGIHFEVIAKMMSESDPNGHAYTFFDTHPADGKNYYRLSETDKDGTTILFDIRQAEFGNKNSLLRLYPNPTVNNIGIELRNTDTGPLKLEIFDVTGSKMYSQEFNKADTYWNQLVNVANLQKGLYVLRIEGKTLRYVKSFIKQ